MKPIESDKHFLKEYYIRKGYRAERINNGLRLWKIVKGEIVYEKVFEMEGNVRSFIESVDKLLK